MSHVIAVVLVQVILSSLGKCSATIIVFISVPETYLLNNDTFYYGVLPPLMATAKAYGFSDLQVGFVPLTRQVLHPLSSSVPFIYLLMDKVEIALGEHQSYIFRWRIGIFIRSMAIGLILGYLLAL